MTLSSASTRRDDSGCSTSDFFSSNSSSATLAVTKVSDLFLSVGGALLSASGVLVFDLNDAERCVLLPVGCERY